MPASHATHLQIRAIGQLDHASSIPFAYIRNHRSLRRAQLAAGQFDPADPTVARGNDAQQPRTRRGPQRKGCVGQSSGGRSLIQDGHRVERRATARAPPRRALLRHRYTPPDDGWHEQSGRQVSWLAGHGPPRPSRSNQWRGAQVDSLHTVAGAATAALCSLFGPEGHRRLYYAFFRTAQRGWTL
jgi:hypothetical protein